MKPLVDCTVFGEAGAGLSTSQETDTRPQQPRLVQANIEPVLRVEVR